MEAGMSFVRKLQKQSFKPNKIQISTTWHDSSETIFYNKYNYYVHLHKRGGWNIQ